MKPSSRGNSISLPLRNMRGVSILFVVGFHSLLAYLAFLPNRPFALDRSPYLWRAFPIIDTARFSGFDLFCAWLNIYLMTFFFFLSGLFVWRSLKKKGRYRFLRDRCVRLGIPFVLAVALLMPIANYPTFLQSSSVIDFNVYWRQWLALPFWPCGPMWFIWLLLAFDILLVATDALVPQWDRWLLRWSSMAADHPVRFLIGLVCASAIAYVPAALAFTPSRWISFGPLSFEPSHLFHYIVYFLAGIGVGAYGVDRGLFASDGWLVRHCRSISAAAVLLFVAWIAATAPTMKDPSAVPAPTQIIAALAFVLACASNCLAVLALGVKYANRPSPALKYLGENAYGIYLVHYPFVIWLQFALLRVDVPALVKAPIVFGGTLLLSRSAVRAARYGIHAFSGFPIPARLSLPHEDVSRADGPPP